MSITNGIESPRSRTILHWLAALGFAALLFVWSLPGVIALRNSLILLLFALLMPIRPRDKAAVRALFDPYILWPLLLLSTWIAVHNTLFAWAPSNAWQESMQWFKALLLFGLGTLIAAVPSEYSVAQRRAWWLGLLLFSYLAYQVIDLALKPWTGTQDFSTILLYTKGLASRDLASYLGTTLVAIMLADVSGHIVKGQGIFLGSIRWRLVALLIATVLTLATMTRNSLPVLALLALVAGGTLFSYVFQKRRALTIGVMLVALVAIVGGAFFSAKSDARWSKLSSSISAGLDITTHKTWLDQFGVPYPVDAAGQPVDSSAYLRTAWIKGLVVEVGRYPLGVGYDRNAFGRALRADYGEWVKTAHGHSGLLDFTLGVGIPGGILLVAFLLALMKIGYGGWLKHCGAASLALLLFSLSYASRALIDGTVRDHMLEQFMFVAGLLVGLANAEMEASA